MAEGDAYGVRSPLQAAKDLQNYLKQKGVSLGSKASPVPFIAAAQTDMGGGLVADGIFGPKTRAQMNNLIAGRVSSAGAAPVPNIAAAAMVAPPQPALAVLPQPAPALPPPVPEPVTVDIGPPVFMEQAPPAPEPVYTPAVVDAVASIPPANRAVMADALNTFAAQPSGTMNDFNALIDAMSAKFGPIIKSISDEVSMQQLQRQATTEHNDLMREDERWSKNNDVLQQIVNKFAELQKILLANDAVSKRVYEVYGVHL